MIPRLIWGTAGALMLWLGSQAGQLAWPMLIWLVCALAAETAILDSQS